ncbi:MAG: hypothetical protein M3081_07305 [Gemmatimonadota bacterium]|nr:hypothetical protein [Gemmatimonadota bacterium]
MNDKQLLALAKKNAAKSHAPKGKKPPVYDATLDATRPAEEPDLTDAQEIFKEMKRREF